MEKSVGGVNFTLGPPLVRSPKEKIDFYYPIPTLAGKYARKIDKAPEWWDRPVKDKTTLVNAGDFVNKTVISGPLAGQLAENAFWYILGLGDFDRKWTLVIHNTDMLGWCYDTFTYLTFSLGGPELEGRGEYALNKITEVNPEMQFLDSNGQPSKKLPLYPVYMTEEGLLPYPHYTEKDVICLIEGMVK